METLRNISPIDGRYRENVKKISAYFSEYALMKYRTFVEVEWLKFLLDKGIINASLNSEDLSGITNDFDDKDALKIKEFEAKTNHDVKAVEYYLRDRFKGSELEQLDPYIHILLTSDDTNSTAYGLMLKDALDKIYYPELAKLIEKIEEKARFYRDHAMLSHAHGQPATPTTVGKEFAIYAHRLIDLKRSMITIIPRAKFSGTVGNYNAHKIAYPKYDWPLLCRNFIESLGLEYNPLTTQIEPHDHLCLQLSYIKIINNIIRDLDGNMWSYISRSYFREKIKEGEAGSSIMPHKVNPINYENSIANTQIANGLIDTLVDNLSISRMQRDLSDSSKMRNIGVILSHCLVSIQQTIKGLDKLVIDDDTIKKDLDANWNVIAEAIQTVMRKNGIADAYEQLRDLSRGKEMSKEDIQRFIADLPLPLDDKQRLIDLTPEKYTGLASLIIDQNN